MDTVKVGDRVKFDLEYFTRQGTEIETFRGVVTEVDHQYRTARVQADEQRMGKRPTTGSRHWVRWDELTPDNI